MTQKILVGYDGSEFAEKALDSGPVVMATDGIRRSPLEMGSRCARSSRRQAPAGRFSTAHASTDHRSR
jgi:hypothetical protein